MRRLLPAFLALCMALSLTACSFRSSEERQQMRAQMDYAKEAPAVDSFDYALDDGARLEPFELYSSDEVTITVLGIYETADEYILPLRLLNTGKDWYSFYGNQCTINGWLTQGSIYEQVCPNGMVDAQFRLAKSDLPLSAGPVGEIDLNMSCSTTGDNGYHDISHTIFLREVEDSTLDAISIAQERGYSIFLLDCREDDYGFYIDLAVENTGDRYLTLYADANPPVINGMDSDLTCWDSVWLDPDTKTVMTLELNWYELEECEVTSADEIQSFYIDLELTRSNTSDYIPLELDGETIQALLDK
ncbi:MAG: hypothetical protein IJX71_06005 [Oscillospiraceae bacterium]|nr:hypothetical protein [Oscillospiraceae bacterium]